MKAVAREEIQDIPEADANKAIKFSVGDVGRLGHKVGVGVVDACGIF